MTNVLRPRFVNPSDDIEVIYMNEDLEGLTNENYWKGLIKDIKPDVVFHFGEYSRLVSSFNNVSTVIDSNLKSTASLFKVCSDFSVPVIYSASSSKYNIEGTIDYDLVNKAPYTYFKSIMVDLLKNMGEWYGLNYKIAYFYNVYGPGQVEHGEYATVMGIWEKAYREGNPLPVVGDGTQTRDFTHISDIVSGLLAVWNKGKNKGEYQLGTGVESRILELAEQFQSEITYLPKLKGERDRSKANIDSTKEELDWEPKFSVSEYINNLVQSKNA